MLYALCVLAGLAAGAFLTWLFVSNTSQGTVKELRRELASARTDFDTLRLKLETETAARVKAETQLTETISKLEDEKQLIAEAKTALVDAFKAVAGDTLNNSTATFLELAKESFEKVVTDAKGDLGARQEAIQGLVKPLSESLKQFDEHVRAIEKNRQESYAGLTEQVKNVSDTQKMLKNETVNLVTALRRPEVRGRWGELTLRRVVELAGMSKYCDFCEQISVETEEGRQRPDMIVNLPDERQVVVDSKAPLDAYLDAIQAGTEEQRKAAMERHASQVRSHMDRLAAKSYWEQFPKAPEFVVMFIAGESFFSAAIEIDTTLYEIALQKRVIIATPATLIALLQTVAYGWRQEHLAENAQVISDLGKQLYDRMSNLAEHVVDIGEGLRKSMEAYNRSVSSLESRVMPAARRFKELGIVSNKDIPVIDTVQVVPRLPDIKNESVE